MCSQVVRPKSSEGQYSIASTAGLDRLINSSNQPIPYRGHIPSGLHEGKIIEIRGTVPYGADVFTVNFLTGLDLSSDRPLHLSVRFSGQVVVRNHLERNAWGPEERHGMFPFAHGRAFTLMIMVEQRCYRIAVNNQNCWEFNHRMPIIRVSSIFIDGSVQIERIEFKGNVTSGPAIHSGFVVGGRTKLPPVYNPIIPYAYPIYGGLYPGMLIYISGRPSASAYRFTINLQAGTSTYNPPDIAFHFDPRFFNRTLVRNSRSSNAWDREETDMSHFPFQPLVDFELLIKVERNRYHLKLNGQHLLNFKHRLSPLSRFDTLYIESDLIVSSIRFA